MSRHDMYETIRKDLNGTWRCNFCGLGFNRKEAVVQHVVDKHADRLNLATPMDKDYKHTVDDVVQLIERWIDMADELPSDPVQVLRDLRDCIKGEGAYKI